MATTVKVYYFKKHDFNTDRKIPSKRAATLETIARVHGEPLMDTEMEIDAADLDGDGFRRDNSN